MTGRVLGRVLAGLGAAAMAACSPVQLLNATVPSGGVSVARGLHYGPDARQVMDVYRPAHPLPGAPGVVFIYGGSWNSGSRTIYPFVAATLARRGVLVFVPDYRLYPQVRFPVFLDDCARAVVWAQGHAEEYGGRADDVFLMGHSAGAYNAAMLATDAGLLRAAGGDRGTLRGFVGLAGPYDFLPMTDPEVIGAFDGRKDDPATQPVTYADGKGLPMLLLAGADDRTVLPRNSVRLAAAVTKAGGVAEARVYPGVGHIGLVISIAPIFQGKDPALADTLAFIQQHSVRP